MEDKTKVVARPIRIIPFDLGRDLNEVDNKDIEEYISNNYSEIEKTPRQNSIFKKCITCFQVDEDVQCYIYSNGITVVVIYETSIEYSENYSTFSISYCQNRKEAHNQLFAWTHTKSNDIKSVIADLRNIIRKNSKKASSIRKSACDTFENGGLSYVMTLSMFTPIVDNECISTFKNYPDWLKSNIYALLDPSVLYLEDSNKFESKWDNNTDAKKILSDINVNELKDYECHRNIDTYMSWAAVIVVGEIKESDIEEYTALEIQLQSDWFYVYCIEKNLDDLKDISKKNVIDYQRQSYELDLLENRLLDFDDSSMPSRIINIQSGLVETSGLKNNIQHLQRRIKYLLERERLNTELKQKKLGQSSEILLFIIAFIEIAPTVAEYGNKVFNHAGTLLNFVIVLLGFILLMRKG